MEAPRELRSLGLGKFLDEYDFWAMMPGYDEAVEYQVQKNISNEVGAIRRAYAAKKIFSDAELLRACLTYAAEHEQGGIFTGQTQNQRIVQGNIGALAAAQVAEQRCFSHLARAGQKQHRELRSRLAEIAFKSSW